MQSMETPTHLMDPMAYWLMLMLPGQVMEEMSILMKMKDGQIVPKVFFPIKILLLVINEIII